MRWARPSTIAVLPTPGSPIRTGLFFVRRLRTWMTRRISSSRPMTGSSLPCSALLGQVAAELLERADSVLGGLVGDAVRAADLGDRLRQAVLRGAGGAQRVARLGAVAGQREQQVLGRDVLVLELAHLALGVAQDPDELAGRAGGLAAGADRGQRRRARTCVSRAHGGGVGAELGEHGRDDAAVLLEQHDEQVLGRDLRVAARSASDPAAAMASWDLIVNRSACISKSQCSGRRS